MAEEMISAVAEPEASVVEPAEGSGAAEPFAEGAAAETQTETEGSGEPLRGSALWRETKTLAREGKPLTPKLLSAINKAIHRAEAIEQKYPDGLQAVEGTLKAVRSLAEDETVPIERVIEETLQERQYFRELDDLYTSGNKEFVEKIAEASPEAFQNIAPAVFRKYAEVNPEGYSAYIAQTVVQHMNAAEIPLQFRILASFLPQIEDSPAKEQVLNAAEALFTWAEGMKSLAQKQVAPKAIESRQHQGNPAQDRESELQMREMNATRIEWNASVQQEGVSMVLSEAAKVAGKTKLSEKEQKTVLSKVAEELEARLSADRRYGEAMQGYLKNGNRQSYIQRIQSERKKLIPGAVRRAVDDVLAARPKVQPKQAATQQKQNPQATRQTQANFRRIAGHPKTQGMTVDLRRTTQGMLLKHQAYIVGEKEPVMWG